MSNIHIEEREKTAIVHLSGIINIENITEVNKILAALFDRELEIIAFDCKYLEHIDSTTINHLIKLIQKAINLNIELFFYNLNPVIKNLFHIMRLEKLITITSEEFFTTNYLI